MNNIFTFSKLFFFSYCKTFLLVQKGIEKREKELKSERERERDVEKGFGLDRLCKHYLSIQGCQTKQCSKKNR